METLKTYLVEHPFLKDLNPDQLELITGCASNVRFNSGELIFREGDDANHFYMIRHGKVAIELFAPDRGSIKVETIGEGEVFGWSWLVAPYKWNFDARAVELTRAVALDGKCLRTKCDEDHDLGYELLNRFMVIMMERFQATRIQLLDLYNANGRGK